MIAIHGSTARWRHQMETFSVPLALCAGNSPVTGEFPSQRPVTRSFDVFLDLRLNKRLSKETRRRWFETPSESLWRHCNGCGFYEVNIWSMFYIRHSCNMCSILYGTYYNETWLYNPSCLVTSFYKGQFDINNRLCFLHQNYITTHKQLYHWNRCKDRDNEIVNTQITVGVTITFYNLINFNNRVVVNITLPQIGN